MGKRENPFKNGPGITVIEQRDGNDSESSEFVDPFASEDVFVDPFASEDISPAPVPLQESGLSSASQQQCHHLPCLGRILHELFDATAARSQCIARAASSFAGAIVTPDIFDEVDNKYRSNTTDGTVDDYVSGEARKKRGKATRTFMAAEFAPFFSRDNPKNSSKYAVPLSERGVPVALSELVSDLLLGEAAGCSSSKAVSARTSSSPRRRCRCYATFAQVEHDLARLEMYPEQFLVDYNPVSNISKANGVTDSAFDKEDHLENKSCRVSFPVPDRLYGREWELAQLVEACDCVLGRCNQPSSTHQDHMRQEMVLVSGYSGTGKSSLVRNAREYFESRGGHFVSGKFDQMRQVRPLSSIADAFNDYCGELLERTIELPASIFGDEDGEIKRGNDSAGAHCMMSPAQGDDALDSIQSAVTKAVGATGASILGELLPNLSIILGPTVRPVETLEGEEVVSRRQSGEENGQYRLMEWFRRFVRALSGSESGHPMVLFLDDLQWADSSCLELIRWLVSDTASRNFLFVGAYRSNEVDESHPLMTQLVDLLDKSGGASISNIFVGNLAPDAVDDLVSDSLRLPPRITSELSSIVHTKTGGNSLFVVQLLRALADDDLLGFSLESRRWEWDAEALLTRKVADNVADLLSAKMKQMSPNAQQVLMAASCFGSQCQESMLRLLGREGGALPDGSKRGCIIDAHPDVVSECIDIIVAAGFMYRVGEDLCVFSHDRIRLAAYCSIPEYDAPLWHLQIGQRLRLRLPDEVLLGHAVAMVVDQFDRGLDLIPGDDLDMLTDVARLNFVAGRKALDSSVFMPASIYLQRAIKLWGGDRGWERDYDFSLRLHNCCAQALLVNGDMVNLPMILSSVFKHAKCFEDKLTAYQMQVVSKEDKALAVKIGTKVLERLGEHFPRPEDVSPNMVIEELRRTQCMLKEAGSIDKLAEMAKMANPSKVWSMLFLARLASYDFTGDQKLFAFFCCRLIHLTLEFGIHKESAYGAAAFASTLFMMKAGTVREAYALGKAAMSILQRLDARDCLARVYIIIFGYINIWVEPIQSSLEMLLHAHEVGLLTGDVWHGCMSGVTYINQALFHSGINLDQLLEEGKVFIGQLDEYGLKDIKDTNVPMLQAMLNLMGQSRDPMELTGEVMNQEELLKSAAAKHNYQIIMLVHHLRLWLAVLFHRHELAGSIISQFEQSGHSKRSRPRKLATETFCNGLTALALMRTDGKQHMEPMVLDALKKMENWTQNCSAWNFEHKLELLLAESFFVQGDFERAMEKYKSSIHHASKRGFIHEEALACEKAALFCAETGNSVSATEYFKRSHALYMKWGAVAKGGHVVEQMSIKGLQ